MSGRRHPSLDKLNRERMRFQRLATASPSEFPRRSVGLVLSQGSPMTELAHSLSDTAHIMSPDHRRRLSMDSAGSSSPGTPLSTITNNLYSGKMNPGKGPQPRILVPQSPSLYNKENVPIIKEDSALFLRTKSAGGGVLEALNKEASASINQTTADLRARSEAETLTTLPDSPGKKGTDGFEFKEDFDLDEPLGTESEGEEEEGGGEGEGSRSSFPTNLATLITNRVLLPPRPLLPVVEDLAPAKVPKKTPLTLARLTPENRFRRCLSLLDSPSRNHLSSSTPKISDFPLPLESQSPVSRTSSFKRPSSPLLGGQDGGENLQVIKRRKIYDHVNKRSRIENSALTPSSGKKLNRSLSEVSFSGLISAGLASSEELTGDMKRAMLFPIVPVGSDVKHHDLKPIDCDTLARLIRGEFADEVESFRVIDARYVYEFEGGHVKGAENFGSWDEGSFFDEFLPVNKGPLPAPYGADTKRKILVFHCEFSSVRGPELMKKLRQKDRCLNKDSYPALYYPECYLLHKGYREFFRLYPELCEPRGYRTMADPNFQKDAKMFHKKSKSWAGGTVARTGNRITRSLNL